MPNLDAILNLGTAERYTHPQRASDPLPFVLGNFLSNDVLPDDDDDGGFTLAPCIDRLNLIYLIHDGPMVSTTPQVYFNGKRQGTGAFTFDPAYNHQNLGPVGAIRFQVRSVLDGEVTIRHAGAVDAQGVPITNPLRGLLGVLQKYNGWTTADVDWGTVQRSIVDMETLAYPVTYCFAETGMTVRAWLLDFLAHYHCDADLTADGKLAIIHDRTLTSLPVTPDFHVEAWMINDGGAPWGAITKEKQLDDLCNQAVLQTRYNWAAGQYTGSFVGDFVQSQAAYQAAYPTDVSLRGMYTTQHATNWLNGFFTRHGFEPTVRRFALRGLRYTPLIPPRLITVEWPPYGWQRRLMKIRRRVTSPARHEVVLECIDCQRELDASGETVDTTVTSRRERLSRVYQYVPGTIGNDGILEDAPTAGRNDAANGDFELGAQRGWDLTGETMVAGSGGAILGMARWTIEESPTLAYQGRFYAKSVAGLPDYRIQTLRRRIDPGEWAMVSAWFRNESGADGQGIATVTFYDTDGAIVGVQIGNGVPAFDQWLESLVLAQAPADSYHYRPGISLFPLPTTGQWRADHVIANTGSRGELLLKRLADLSAGDSLIFNGDFEAGNANWVATGGWYLDTTIPRSGTYHVTHRGSASQPTGRMSSLTRVPIVGGRVVGAEAYFRTTGNPDGQVLLGVTWLDGQNVAISELRGTPLSGSWPTYAWWGGTATVPTGTVYAHFWFQVEGHTAVNTYWSVDDVRVYISA